MTETKIRVLQINKLYHPATGGIEAAVQELAEGCRDFSDLDTEVLVCQLKGRGRREILNGVPVYRAGSLGLIFRMPFSLSFPFQLRQQVNGFDIAHVHLPFPLALFGPWNRKDRSTRLVVHYHMDVVRPVQKGIMAVLATLHKRILDHADVILVGSEPMIQACEALAPYQEKCKVLPYAVNPERFSQHWNRTGDRLFGVNENKPLVLFVGRLVYYKGLEYLIHAMRDIDAQLVIAGDGPLRSALEILTARLGLLHRVKFAGSVSDAHLTALYRTASVFVLPSVECTEAFGLVQVEAMLHGLPVINTWLRTGVPLVSIDGKTGITVPPRDSVALANAVNRLITDQSLHSQLSANAIRRAAYYAPQRVMAQLRKIYLSLYDSGLSSAVEFQKDLASTCH